ncbi:MAG: hypothetical protein GX045_10945 [Clostridiaceae bacterium]|jgi:hypothetical protein|nr:hypothetical protein [Clostridiaceae bacterium]
MYFEVPSDEAGTVWTVFEIEGDKIIPVNSFLNVSNPSIIRSLDTSNELRMEDIELFLDLPEKGLK